MAARRLDDSDILHTTHCGRLFACRVYKVGHAVPGHAHSNSGPLALLHRRTQLLMHFRWNLSSRCFKNTDCKSSWPSMTRCPALVTGPYVVARLHLALRILSKFPRLFKTDKT